MTKRKAEKLKAKARQISFAMRIEALTDAEVAARLKQTGRDFLRSVEWQALRLKAIDHYGGRCMCCGYTPKRGVNVDHIKPRKTHPHLALEFENLQILCSRCNKRKGNRHETDYRASKVPVSQHCQTSGIKQPE